MINIFFGSTINREQVEKEQIELFVRNLNKKFKEIKSKVDVRVKPLFKNEINNLQALINEAEYSFFIIFKSVTTEDTDEIIYAVKQYEEHNKPKVYVYFKTINDDDSINDEINILKDKISSEFSHYYQVFTNIEEIKLRLIENVFSDKLTNALVIEDDTLKFEGIDLGGYINYKDIPEFANHEELKELRKAYEEVQKQYITISSKENCEFLELEKTYAQKEILREKISELEQKILKLSINLVELINQRMDSETISKAMQLFSEGKVKECIELLKLTPTSDLIKKAYELKSKSEEDKEKAIGNVVWAIKENKIIIDLLHISDDYENKQELIDNLYEQTATWAIQFEVMLDEVFDYIKYCIKQNYLDKAYKYLEQIEFLITDKSERKYPLLYAKLYNIKAFVSSMNDDYEETIELYRTSIDYFQNSKNLELEHEEYLYGLFNSYFEVGCLLSESNYKVPYEQSEQFFDNAKLVCKELLDINFLKYSDLMSKFYSKYSLQSYYKYDPMLGEFFETLINILTNVDHEQIVSLESKKEIEMTPQNIIKIADCNYTLGVILLMNFNLSMEYFNTALDYYNKIKLKDNIELKTKIAQTYSYMGLVNKINLKYPEAIEYLTKAKEIFATVSSINKKYYSEFIKNYTFLLLSYIESSPKDLESSVSECLSEISKFREHIKDQMISETLLFYAQLGLSLSLIGQTELSSKLIEQYENTYFNLNFDEFNVNSESFLNSLFFYIDTEFLVAENSNNLMHCFSLFLDVAIEAARTKDKTLNIVSILLCRIVEELSILEANDEWNLLTKEDCQVIEEKIEIFNSIMYEDESVRQMIEDGSYKDIISEQFQLFDEASSILDALEELKEEYDENATLDLENKIINTLIAGYNLINSHLENIIKNETYTQIQVTLSSSINNGLANAISDFAFIYKYDNEELFENICKYLDYLISIFKLGTINIPIVRIINGLLYAYLMVYLDDEESFNKYFTEYNQILSYLESNTVDDTSNLLLEAYRRKLDILEECDEESPYYKDYIETLIKYINLFNNCYKEIKDTSYIDFYYEVMLYYLEVLNDIDDEQGMFTSAEEVATLIDIFGNQIEYLRDYLTVDSYEHFVDICCEFAEYIEDILDEGVDDPDLKDMMEFFYDLSTEIEEEFEGKDE